ncbi:MAG: twin-arginine translocase TatA/TatE family subunit [Pseudomonadota bacterium]|nr:twin-arginine translocase TatA/TatE family subunit [Pseudomonadota bacterium]
MGIGGIWQWVVVLAIVLVLFGGRGKISQLMGDFGKGLRSFKKGVKEDDPQSVEEKESVSTTQATVSEAEPKKE